MTITDLGQSWSEPQFGVVKTSTSDTVGTPVMFIGGGYSSDNSSGKAILAINVLTGAVVKTFKNFGTLDQHELQHPQLGHSGGLERQRLHRQGVRGRHGRATVADRQIHDFHQRVAPFPNCDENITNWEAQLIFVSDSAHTRKFFYPPALTLEKGYDLLFIGTGDRENACAGDRRGPILLHP